MTVGSPIGELSSKEASPLYMTVLDPWRTQKCRVLSECARKLSYEGTTVVTAGHGSREAVFFFDDCCVRAWYGGCRVSCGQCTLKGGVREQLGLSSSAFST